MVRWLRREKRGAIVSYSPWGRKRPVVWLLLSDATTLAVLRTRSASASWSVTRMHWCGDRPVVRSWVPTERGVERVLTRFFFVFGP